MAETVFEIEIEIKRHGDSIYTGEVIPFRVPCYSFTRDGAIARAREWFVDLIAQYEATGRLAELVEKCERLSGPDRVDNLTLAELLLKMPEDSEHITVTHRPAGALSSC